MSKYRIIYYSFFILFLTGCSKEKSGENNIVDFYFPNRQHEVKMEATDINVFMSDVQPVDNMVPVIEVSNKVSVLPASHVAHKISARMFLIL